MSEVFEINDSEDPFTVEDEGKVRQFTPEDLRMEQIEFKVNELYEHSNKHCAQIGLLKLNQRSDAFFLAMLFGMVIVLCITVRKGNR